MLISCFANSIYRSTSGADASQFLQCRAVLDTDSGHIHLERRDALPDTLVYDTTIDLLIGTRVYCLNFDVSTSSIPESELALHHEEFEALYIAQETLGISGKLTYH